MTLEDHVTVVGKACYFQIHALRHIRASIPDNVANMIACSIVGSRLDYYNSLLAGISEVNYAKLQCVQNTLARILTGTGRYEHVKQEVIHITPVLAKLHWLPAKARLHSSWSHWYISSGRPVHHHTSRHFFLITNRWESFFPRFRECGIVDSLTINLKTDLYNIAYKSTWVVPTTPTNGRFTYRRGRYEFYLLTYLLI